MSETSSCPAADGLQSLLEDSLPDKQRLELEAHVESCPACQQVLEVLSDDDTSQVARHLGDEDAGAETALLQAMDDMKRRIGGVATTHDEETFSFLSPSDVPQSIGRLGIYEISEIIGRGGMGVVLKGHDPRLNRFVAIKVLTPELASNANARKRFRREGQAAAAVSHDHVVTIHAVDEANGLPYLVMEYISGLSLQERIARDGPLELKEVLRVGMQTAAGLAAAHAQGLVHRDIKPANILLENGVERVKITDFGLARAVDDVRITQQGVVTGTPEYMSPEQARSEPVDHRSDLFSLGCVLYAMCTGRPPFRAESTVAMIRRVCDDEPRPIGEVNSDIPEWLTRFVGILLAKDPEKRVQSTSEAADLLGKYLAHVQRPSVNPAPPQLSCLDEAQRTMRIGRRPGWLTAAAVVLAVLGGLGLTEASGFTQISSTIIRVFRGDGTLIIQVDDPNVQVAIDGEELVLQGAGPKEIRVRPGNHQVAATKNGERVHMELVTISRGGKQLVTISRESLPGGVERRGDESATELEVPTKTPTSVGPKLMLSEREIDDGNFWDMMPSPDGSRIAYSANEFDAIFVRDLASGNVSKVASGKEIMQPVWSPDGKRIAYFSQAQPTQIRLVDLQTGSTSVPEWNVDRMTYVVDWSPDGKHVLCVRKRRGRNSLVLIAMATGAMTQLTSSDENAAARGVFSRDGRYVAFSATVEGNADVFISSIDGDEKHRITNSPLPETRPIWSPAGDTLVYAKEGRLWAIPVADGRPTGEPRFLRNDLGQLKAWTRQGKLYYVLYNQDSTIYSLSVDPRTGKAPGTTLSVLNSAWSDAEWMAWSPNMQQVAVDRARDGKIHIYSTSPNTVQSFTVGPPRRPLAKLWWSGDGKQVHFVLHGANRGRRGILALNPQSGEIRPMPAESRFPLFGGRSRPQLSADGQRMVCLTGVFSEGSGKLVVFDFGAEDGGSVIAAEQGGDMSFSRWVRPLFSPDGSAVLYASSKKDEESVTFWEAAVDGSGKREITSAKSDDEDEWINGAAWDPTGRFIVYSNWKALVVVNRETGKREESRIPRHITENVRVVQWSPDGRQIAFVGSRSNPELWSINNLLVDSSQAKLGAERSGLRDQNGADSKSLETSVPESGTASLDERQLAKREPGAGAASDAERAAEVALTGKGARIERDEEGKVTEVLLFGPREKYTNSDVAHLIKLGWRASRLDSRLFALPNLHLGNATISDEGLARLVSNVTSLRTLHLGPGATNTGLQHVKALPHLETLSIRNTQITDEGLVHLKGLSKLRFLIFGRSRGNSPPNMHVTDEGLEHLKGLVDLTALLLDGTKITDKGLIHLESLTNLRRLGLAETEVTAEGVERLREALPACRIRFQ